MTIRRNALARDGRPNRRLVRLSIVGFLIVALIAGTAIVVLTRKAHEATAIDDDMKTLSAPARRQAPVSLRPKL